MRTRAGEATRSQWRGRGDWRTSRSSVHGYGRGRGYSTHQASYPGEADVRAPSPPTGSLIETLEAQNLLSAADTEHGEPRISDCSFLGSFNWMCGETPTITIPGMPPVWKPLKEPVQLEEDAGEYFRDPNAARFPDFPMEPAVQALLTQCPTLSTSDIDLFACGSTLGNLSRLVRGVEKPFRFIVEVIGSTVFFLRRENTPDEKLTGVRGYGHSFPDTYTQWEAEVKGSESHQRLIGYTFAGLKCVVRFEGDGYLEEEAHQSFPKEGLSPSLSSGRLNVRIKGKMIPQEAIFDLKTRTAKRKDEDVLSEELPRLWVTQIPHFVLAFHVRGLFTDISVKDVRKEVQAWETLNAKAIRKLGALIHKIVKLARDSPDRKCEVRCQGDGKLETRRQLPDAPRPLPEHTRERWLDGQWSSAVSDESDASDGADASSQSGGQSEGAKDFASFSDEESEKDYTACSEACGYCGRCDY